MTFSNSTLRPINNDVLDVVTPLDYEISKNDKMDDMKKVCIEESKHFFFYFRTGVKKVALFFNGNVC